MLCLGYFLLKYLLVHYVSLAVYNLLLNKFAEFLSLGSTFFSSKTCFLLYGFQGFYFLEQIYCICLNIPAGILCIFPSLKMMPNLFKTGHFLT